MAMLAGMPLAAAQAQGYQNPIATSYSSTPPSRYAAQPRSSSTAVQRASYQVATSPVGVAPDSAAQDYQIPLDPPGSDRLFRLESESQLQERMRQEARNRYPMERIVFPDEPILAKDSYAGRSWPHQGKLVEPNFVCYGRLIFEQKNMERYGWDLGPLSLVASPLTFFKDVVCAPYRGLSDPCRHHECNTGYCLPGDPVPLLIYPPGLSATGTFAEAASIVAVLAIFP